MASNFKSRMHPLSQNRLGHSIEKSLLGLIDKNPTGDEQKEMSDATERNRNTEKLINLWPVKNPTSEAMSAN